MDDEQFVKRVDALIAAAPGKGGLFYIAWMVMKRMQALDAAPSIGGADAPESKP